MKAKIIIPSLILLSCSILLLNRCTTEVKSSAAVSSPFKGVVISSKTFDFSPTSSSVLTVDRGTKINIPENAFVDNKNQPVKGNVKISYTEYITPTSVIASGIPMDFQNGDKTEHLQSAGMFRLEANQNGEPVHLADGKNISVNMTATKQGEGFRYYFLDTASGKWEDIGNASIQQANAGADKKPNDVVNVSAPPAKPVMLKKYNPDAFVFDFAINYSNFPFLKQFDGIIWQYAGEATDQNNPENNNWIFSRNWSKINIEPIDEEALTFKLTLSDGSTKYSAPISPVLKGKNYEKALAKFKKKDEEYKNLMLAYQQEGERKQTEQNLTTTFSVKQMGIYNCDRFYNNPNAVAISAGFEFDSNINPDVTPITVYMITGNDVIYYNKQVMLAEGFKFDPTSTNKLVAILPGNRLAVFTDSEFKRLDIKSLRKQGAPFVFRLHTLKESIQSTSDLDKVLSSI